MTPDLIMRAGSNSELPAHCTDHHIDVIISNIVQDGVDLDLSAVAVDDQGRVTADEDFVFFNNVRHPSGAVEHLGQRVQSGRSYDAVRVTVGSLPPHLAAVHVTLSGQHEGLPSVPDLQVEVFDHLGGRIAAIDTSTLSSESAAVLLHIYRRAGMWKLRSVVQGWDAGFSSLVEHYGVDIGAPREPLTPPPELIAQAAPPVRPVPPVPPAYAAPDLKPEPRSNVPGQPPNRAMPLSTAPPSQDAGKGRRGLFGPRRRELQDELEAARQQLVATGAMDALDLAHLTAERRVELDAIQREIASAKYELHSLHAEMVEVDDVNMLQAAGIYDFAHPLEDAVAYKERIKLLKDRYKQLVRDNRAVEATTNWSINGSTREGAKMVKDTSKLMLRAYNAEADNCVRVVRPHSLPTNLQRLDKARDAIAKLGSIMSITITSDYHRRRVEEIRLTADYHARVEEEREAQREARDRAREDRQAQLEYERERERLDKERAQVERALDVALNGSASEADVELLRERLLAVDAEIDEAAERAANARLGFVYVISNIGAFGPDMVKIGMTRRREPMDRVRELGDASVPFLFDVHALIFSEDALGLEAKLHAAFADQRVNRINLRREFFRVTPDDVRRKLAELGGEHLLDFKDTALADEWRRSLVISGSA